MLSKLVVSVECIVQDYCIVYKVCILENLGVICDKVENLVLLLRGKKIRFSFLCMKCLFILSFFKIGQNLEGLKELFKGYYCFFTLDY